jgi:glycosyltransferase involved in cell wall biosynthesis/peptidoglycan/xylan/chitin deacetylase (PgdA/CDA1 family)
MSETPRISVVVPTFQRRYLVTKLVGALDRQVYDKPFEAVVVVDGSSDGTDSALSSLSTAFPMRIIFQSNQGLARARNRGADEARGEILLFLDDDMEPDPHLLAEHDRYHSQGAMAVSGAIPLHPDSPSNLLSNGVGLWAEERARRLQQTGVQPRYFEIVSGQFSVRRNVFEELGGFDERFTAAGSYGNEDLDFGHRFIKSGHPWRYNPAAISRQHYVVEAANYLRQYRQVGEADVALVRKFPELRQEVFHGELAQSTMHRLARIPVFLAPRLAIWLTRPLGRWISARIDAGGKDAATARLLFLLRAIAYWRGVQDAGGIPRARPMRVLCYHAIADLAGDPVLEQYGIPVSEFSAQIDLLRRAGYRFIHPEEFLRYLEGRGGVPRKAALLTFDDCYLDLRDAAAGVLSERAIPAIAFAVTGQLGGQNAWDQAIGARALDLLDAKSLKALSDSGMEIGAHSRTHRELTKLSDAEIESEVAGSLEDLDRLGLGSLRFFSYPHGTHDAKVCASARDARVRAAFTVDPGSVHPKCDPLRLPRIEIMRRDTGWRLRLKVALFGRRLMIEERAGRRLRRALRPRS